MSRIWFCCHTSAPKHLFSCFVRLYGSDVISILCVLCRSKCAKASMFSTHNCVLLDGTVVFVKPRTIHSQIKPSLNLSKICFPSNFFFFQFVCIQYLLRGRIALEQTAYSKRHDSGNVRLHKGLGCIPSAMA